MVDQPANLSFAPSDIVAWHYEKLAGRLLLYFDCDRSIAVRIVKRLRQHGLFVEVWRPSRSPARNGHLYQYYLELARSAVDGNLPELGEVFDAVEELRLIQPEPDETTRVRAQLDEAQRLNVSLMAQLREARASIRSLEAQRDIALRRWEQQYQASDQEVNRLADENQALRSQLSQALTSATSQEVVQRRLQQLDQENTSLRKRVTDQAQQLKAVDELLDEATANSKRLHTEKAELEEEVAELRESTAKVAEAEAPEVTEVLHGLLGKLVILPESLGYVFRGIKDRHFILELLCKLNQDCELIRHKTTKQVKTADDWMERHFSTGQGDEGRLYYSKPDKAGKRYVLIAPKDEQNCSIRRLQNLNY
jgi:hypothetical protein